MTRFYHKSALSCSPALLSDNRFMVAEPTGDYRYPRRSLLSVQDELESHLALYHYHTTALVQLACGENNLDASRWEYGANLLTHHLNERSEQLLDQLSQVKDS